MYSKKTKNMILAVIAIVLIGGAIYFALNKKPQPTGNQNPPSGSQTPPATGNDGNSNVPPTTVATKYTNSDYGFDFTLPDSWKGFTVVTSSWEGYANQDSGQVLYAQGPEISLRHPLWTQQNPRQDIPIMIFTLQQWDDMQRDKFHIGAAPINPSELGRNAKYVFALPARYNFAFPTGYEEVEQILSGNPLKAF